MTMNPVAGHLHLWHEGHDVDGDGMSTIWDERVEAAQDAGGDNYGEILRVSTAARASLIRAENEQLHAHLDQLRSKASGFSHR